MVDHRRFIRFIGDETLALLGAVSTIGVVVSLAALLGTPTPSYGESDPNKFNPRHHTGQSWRSSGTACTGASCPGWIMLDNHPATRTIAGAQP